MRETQGWITIGTKLDSSQLEKDLKVEQKKLEQFEKDTEKLTTRKIKLEAEIEIEGKEFDRKIKEIQQKAEIDIKAVTGGSIYARKAKEDKIRESAQLKINQLTEQYNQYLAQSDSELEDIETKLKENAYNQGLINTNIKDMSSQLAQTKSFDNIKDSINQIGNSIQGVTKKIVRWGLAIFGIRGAYMLVRQAMSTLMQYDDQMATDIQYIKYALANTLKPVIEWILNLIKQLLYYVGYLAKAWFGVDIYAKSSAKDFANANKNAKQLSKTIAGFDEMNVLNENGTTGIGNTPSFSLAAPEDVPIPSWLTWLKRNGDAIAAALSGIAAGLIAVKLGFKGVKALGIGIAVAGIVRTIQKIIDFMKDPTFENFIGILEGIAIAVAGIGIAFGNLPLLIIGVIGLIIVEIVKHFEDIKKLFNKLIEWMDKNVLGGLRTLFGSVGNLIYAPIKAAIDLVYGLFDGLFGGVKRIIDGIVKMFKGDFLGGIKDVFGGLFDILMAPFNSTLTAVKDIFTSIVNFIIDMINQLIDALNKISFTIPDWVPGIGGKKFGINLKRIARVGEKEKGGGGGFRAKGGIFYPTKLPKLAVGGIINNPGAGVPYHGATIGERGAEAVVPLTDSQQMMLLGEAIGRYITVNLTNVTELDGRQIARKVDKIQQNNNFVLNR